jgi:hypothetical protein
MKGSTMWELIYFLRLTLCCPVFSSVVTVSKFQLLGDRVRSKFIRIPCSSNPHNQVSQSYPTDLLLHHSLPIIT